MHYKWDNSFLDPQEQSAVSLIYNAVWDASLKSTF